MTADTSDIAFRDRFEACTLPLEDFGHREHLRLAYVYLCEDDLPEAAERMRQSLKRYLGANGVPETKYHETMTQAWMRAVRHIMAGVGPVGSFAALMDADARLLDTRIMYTHYSRDRLLSDSARAAFLPPDLDPIPHHA